MSFFSIISHASQIHRTRFCVEHKRSNRECLFYSSLIPTTSKNDNFYIVRCVHMCVSEAHARWMCDCVCIRVYVCVCECVSATDVAMCRCIVVLCCSDTKYQRKSESATNTTTLPIYFCSV